MEKLIARRAFKYDKRPLDVGDEFDAKPLHALLLRAIGHAGDAERAAEDVQDQLVAAKRGRGRPPGSKNKNGYKNRMMESK